MLILSGFGRIAWKYMISNDFRHLQTMRNRCLGENFLRFPNLIEGFPANLLEIPGGSFLLRKFQALPMGQKKSYKGKSRLWARKEIL